MADWNSLLDVGSNSWCVFWYEYSTRTVVDGSCIPWPIRWLLGAHHHKHIFATSKLPNLYSLRKELNDFCHKVRWQWKLRNEAGRRRTVKVPNTGVVPCNATVPPELSAWLANLSNSVIAEARRGCSRASACRSVSNRIPLVGFALKLLRSRGWVAVKNDKEPGFSVMTVESKKDAMLEVLSSDSYVEMRGDIPVDAIIKKYFALCNFVGKTVDDMQLAGTLKKSIFAPRASLFAELNITVKSTKGDGLVSVRNLHCAPSHSLAGLSVWVDVVLSGYLASKAKHLIVSSEQLKSLVAKVRVGDSSRLMRIDLDHFFMSGNHDQLAHLASKIVDCPGERRAVNHVLRFLLRHQYIRSRFLGDRTWVANKGSGMGLRHSSSVCDAVLYVLAEVDLITPHVLSHYEIPFVCRFRDDLLLIYNNFEKVRQWYDLYSNAAASVFSMSVIEVSRSGLDMLALFIYRDGQTLLSRPRDRRYQGPPLSTQSEHPPFVHKGWPISVLKTQRNLCSVEKDFRAVKQLFLSRFERYSAPDWLLNKLANVQFAGVQKPQLQNFGRNDSRWLVISWHPVWKLCNFGRVLLRISQNPVWKSLLACAWELPVEMNIRVAYRNSLRYLVHLVQSTEAVA